MEKNINRYCAVLTVMAVFSAMLVPCAFASIFTPSTGDWANPANWSSPSGAIPGAADSVYIRGGRIATISSDVGTITKFYIGDSAASYPPGTGTLNINGGKLIVSGDAPAIGRQVSGAVGTLNLSGGTLQLGNDTSGTNRMYVGLDNATTDAQGFFNISGGTFIGRLLVGSTGIAGATADRVTITGDAAIIGSTSSTGYGLELRSSGTVEWIFDSTGVSCLDYRNQQTVVATDSDFIVDLAAYTGGAQTFTLLNSTAFYNSRTPVVTLLNAPEGTTYSLTDGDFTVTTVVPEPATIGMIVIGALAMLTVNRRRMSR